MSMPKKTKRDFGSFHASNVEEMLALSTEEYQAPNYPVDSEEYPQHVPFGLATREAHFYLEKTCTFLNHGAFGCTLKHALAYAQKMQVYCEQQPLRFMDRQLLPLLCDVTRKLADFIDCDARCLALVENATTATNSVISSLPLKSGDTVFYLSCTYGAVKKHLKFMEAKHGWSLHEEPVSLPLNPTNVIELVAQKLPAGTKWAIFDHIPSNLPMIMPIKELISICHSRGVRVMIDGAHALGSLHLCIRTLQPDVYVMNAHKWFCAPKGAAALCVSESLKSSIFPAVKSHGLGSGFSSQFLWTGLRDYTALLSLPLVIAFWQDYGVDKVLNYNHSLLVQAATHLKEVWQSDIPIPLLNCGSMALVGLPSGIYPDTQALSYDQAEKLQNILFHEHNIEVPVKCVDGKLYVRISTHIHNEFSQYEYLASVVRQIQARTLHQDYLNND